MYRVVYDPTVQDIYFYPGTSSAHISRDQLCIIGDDCRDYPSLTNWSKFQYNMNTCNMIEKDEKILVSCQNDPILEYCESGECTTDAKYIHELDKRLLCIPIHNKDQYYFSCCDADN